MIPHPSIMGSMLLFLAFFLYVASMQSASGLLLLILGILFAIYLLNVVQAIRSCRALRVEPPPTMTGTEGEPLRDRWRVRNTGRGGAGHATITGSLGPLVQVGALAAGAIARLTPKLVLPVRGVYPLRELSLVSTYPFGLIQCRKPLALSGEIVIYPAVYPCPAPPAAGFEPMVGGRFRGQRRTSLGDSFHGVRPSQPADPLKLIHWPSSAKGLGLMVKEFEEELSGRVGLIMDVTPARGPKGENLLDWAARAAGSLTLAALDAGHHVSFLRLGEAEPLLVPPFADGTAVLAALARLAATREGRTAAALLAAAERLPRKASVVLVLTGVDDAVREFLAIALPANRRAAVYLPATVDRQAAADLGVPVAFYRARSLGGRE